MYHDKITFAMHAVQLEKIKEAPPKRWGLGFGHVCVFKLLLAV